MDYTKKFAEEAAAKIRESLKALDLQEFDGLSFKEIVEGASEKARKVQADNGTFDVIVSTEVKDRAGEIVKQDGWDLVNYKNNPIVLWGHDYYSLPVGACLETYQTTFRGVPALGARGIFLSADINPYAQQVRKLYEFGTKQGAGVGCTTSVGFIPKEFDPQDQSIITRSELLEFSFVPVPANQGVGPASGRSLTLSEAKEIGLDVAGLTAKGLAFAENAAPEASVKEAGAGDECERDDGSPGILATDPNDPGGALVCVPAPSGKTVKTGDDGEFPTALAAEQARHAGVVKAAIADFSTKAAAVIADKPAEGDDAEKKAAKAASAETQMKKVVKALGDRLSEENDNHRSKNIEAFRSYAPPDEKKAAMDREPHIKALKDEHGAYEKNVDGSMGELKERMLKTVAGDMSDSDADDGNSNTDWITEAMDGHLDTHAKGVMTCANAMCAAFDKSDETEEKSFLTKADVAALMDVMDFSGGSLTLDADGVRGIIEKIGAKLSSASKKKLEEAHGHIQQAAEVIRALHGGIAEPDAPEDGDEGDGDDQDTDPTDKTIEHGAPADLGLVEFVITRDLARSLAGSLNTSLFESRKAVRTYYRKERR